MHTCAVTQSLGPHSVPSAAGSLKHPLEGSQRATWHLSWGSGQAAAKCTQPPTGSHASTVQRSPSSHETAEPMQTPCRHWPCARHALSELQAVPSASVSSTQVFEAASRCDAWQGVAVVQSAGATLSPSSGTSSDTSPLMASVPLKVPAASGANAT